MLWQLQLSHYNEKVRWALDHKRIPHTRRSLVPGIHALVCRVLTGDVTTTPVLTLDGESIGDSTRIIGALERRWPTPPLYPQEEEQRRRALELEEFFDEKLGPHIRRAAYEHLLDRPDVVIPLFTHGQGAATRAMMRATFPALRAMMRRRLNVNPDAAERSRNRTAAAMDRLEAEIQPSGYLVGDSFTVADLTAAALLYPVVRPPEFPYPTVADPPAEVRELLDPLAERPGGRWVAEMYRRHRRPHDPARPSRPRPATGQGET